MSRELLSSQEATAVLPISARTLFTLRQEGKIAFVRIGSRVFYRREALEDFIRRQESPRTGDSVDE